MKQFSGRVVAITGAASGIGRALAIDLASRGAHLALADLDAADFVFHEAGVGGIEGEAAARKAA